MREKQSLDKIKKMSDEERISLAGTNTNKMLDELLGLIDLHSNNAILTYSDKIAGQIPRSYAANAFNTVQTSLFYSELFWLCKFWDRIDLDKSSIPTTISLIDKESIYYELIRKKASGWSGSHFDGSLSDDIRNSFVRDEIRFGKLQAFRAMRRLKRAVLNCRKIIKSDKLNSIRNARDKAAHMLEKTHSEKTQGIALPMKYGFETEILSETRQIIDALHLSINQSSFAWEDTIHYSTKCAQELWHNCSISIR